MVDARLIWHERYRRATAGKVDSQLVRLWHDFIAVIANARHIGGLDAENPYYREPPDLAVIREGSLAALDRIGERVGIGPFPRWASRCPTG